MRLEQCPAAASAAISVGGYSPWLRDMFTTLDLYLDECATLVLSSERLYS